MVMKKITFYNYPKDKNDQSEKNIIRSEKSVIYIYYMSYDSQIISPYLLYDLSAEEVLY